jgi:hypothetical protein
MVSPLPYFTLIPEAFTIWQSIQSLKRFVTVDHTSYCNSHTPFPMIQLHLVFRIVIRLIHLTIQILKMKHNGVLLIASCVALLLVTTPLMFLTLNMFLLSVLWQLSRTKKGLWKKGFTNIIHTTKPLSQLHGSILTIWYILMLIYLTVRALNSLGAAKKLNVIVGIAQATVLILLLLPL